MNTPSAIPPVIGTQKTIVYEMTRWDLFANWMTVIFRNRILQFFILAVLLFNGWLTLAPKLSTHSLPRLIVDTFVFLFGFLALILLFHVVLGLANAFIPKHRGVVGRHVLEITEQGLVERTECNETLHRWSSICRIFSAWGYIFIYVSDNNFHQVPKRCFPPSEIESFEAELRQRATQLKR